MIARTAAFGAMPGRLARRFLCSLAGQGGGVLGLGVFMVLLARAAPERLGQFSLCLVYGSLTAIVTGLGFRHFLVTCFAAQGARPRRLLAEALRVQLALFLAALALDTALAAVLGYAPDKALAMLLMSAGFGAGALCEPFFALCRVRGRQDAEMRVRLAGCVPGFLFGLACLAANAPMVALALFKLLEGGVMLWLIRRALHRPARRARPALPAPPRWLGGWRPALAFMGMTACTLLYNRFNVTVLDMRQGAAALGLYDAPWQVVDALCTIVSGVFLGKVLFPQLAGLWRTRRAVFARQCALAGAGLALLAAGCAAALLLWGGPLLTLLFGARYVASEPVLHALLPVLPAAFLHGLGLFMLICMGRHNLLLLISLIGLGANVVLCLWLVPAQGAVGAALAVAGTKTLLAALALGAALRLLSRQGADGANADKVNADGAKVREG